MLREPLDLGAFSEHERIVHTVQHLSLGNTVFARFFLCTLAPERAKELMNSLLDSGPPATFVPTAHLRTQAELKWAEVQLLRSLGEDIPDYQIPIAALVETEFQNMKDKAARALRAALADLERSPADVQRGLNFAGAFLKFMQAFPALAAYLLQRYWPLFARIPMETMLATHHFASLNLFPTKIDLSKIDLSYTNSKDFEDLFQVPYGIKHPEFFLQIQNQIISRYCYPDSPSYEVDRSIRSLSGTTILNSRHFIDRIRLLSKQLFDFEDYKEAYRIASTFKRIGMWIFAAHSARNFIGNFPKFAAGLTGVPETPSMITNFVQRLRNDERFLGMMRILTGQILRVEDMQQKSVPLHLLPVLLAGNPTGGNL